ncbi:MAG: hypothetical protein ACLFPS_08665, partial [Clostridia bacterium]
MKLTKVFAVVALVGLFVAGSAFAIDEVAQIRNGNNGVGIGSTNMGIVSNMSDEEIEAYRLENCPDGLSMIDNLKEQGLYEEWKENVLSDFNERLEVQVENGRITEEEAAEVLASLEEKIEQG